MAGSGPSAGSGRPLARVPSSGDTGDRGGVERAGQRWLSRRRPAVAPERDVLLATKLHMPASRPGLVPRPRLADGSMRAWRGDRTGLRARPGTARRSCWPTGPGAASTRWPGCRWSGGQRPRPVLAPRRRRAGPGAPGDRRPGRRRCSARPRRRRSRGWSRPWSTSWPPGPPDEALLVLDDYHVIGSPPVHESLGFLLEHRPPGLQRGAGQPSDPPLALARLRARGQLAELRAAELRFTPARRGAAAAVAAARPALPDAAVAALAARTEGWAAGLQLAALSLRGQHDVAGFVAAFTGSHRYVLDYLAEEVLERQGEQVRTFLLETSVLERLCGPLCDAVTGRAGSQALLEQVERAGLFLVPLDEVRGWWRYHHLFADLLRARLQAEQPGRVAQLHRNAAAWYEEHGLADDAIRHAVAAGEMTWAARLIEQHFDAVFYLRGEGATIQRWMRRCPMNWSGPGPGCCWRRLSWRPPRPRGGGGAAARCGRASVRRLRPTSRWSPLPAGPRNLLVNVPALIALQRSYLAQLRGDAEGTAAFARGPWPRSARTSGCWGHRAGESGRGRVAARPAGGGRARLRVRHRRVAGGRPADVDCMGHDISWPGPACPGAAGAAVETCEQALEVADARPRRCRVAGLAHCAWPRWPTNETSSRQHASRHRRHRAVPRIRLTWRRSPPAWRPWRGSVITGDPAGAREAINEAEQASPSPAGLLNPVPAQRAQLLLAQGRPAPGRPLRARPGHRSGRRRR